MESLTAEPFAFDLARRELSMDGNLIALTSKEYELALYLFRHQNEVNSRRHLLEVVWDTSADIHTRTVDAHISRLRQKLNLSDTLWEIAGIYKRGYCLRKAGKSSSRDVATEVELNTND